MAELILKEVFYRYPGTKNDVLKLWKQDSP